MSRFYPAYKACPICDSGRIRPALTIHYWRENPLSFSDCEECRACFANPMPSDELITQGNDALVRWYQQGRTFEHEFRDARQAFLRGKLLARKLQRWKKSGTLLDVGCFNGFLPLGVQETNAWKAEGVEISPTMARFVLDRLGLVCHQGTLEELNLPNGSYDFILCQDLIEHINQPRKFLQELARILKPGGRLQITTPNVVQDLAYARRSDAAGIPFAMLLNHIMYFSTDSLRKAVESVGLRVKRMYTYDVRHSAKDFGWFGRGKPTPVSLSDVPSMQQALGLPTRDLLEGWTAERLQELRKHPRVSLKYGFLRESLPKALTIPMPEGVGIGHEIYSLIEKP